MEKVRPKNISKLLNPCPQNNLSKINLPPKNKNPTNKLIQHIHKIIQPLHKIIKHIQPALLLLRLNLSSFSLLSRLDGTLVVEQSLIRQQSGQWLATHHFGPYLVWRAVRLARYYQSAGPDMPKYMFVFLPIVSYNLILWKLFDILLRNYSQPFIPYVLEGGGWGGSIVLRDETYDRCWIVV